MAYGNIYADTLTNSNNQVAVSTPPGFRNRIINGAMMIDQRNAGASVTVNDAAQFFPVDRMFGWGQASDGVYTLQRSTTVPSGFTNSIVATITTADASIGAGQLYFLSQRIEGTNIADLDWGLATAKTVTLSFWVRSSLTGTFGGALGNSAGDRSYPFTYTINSANTWEQKSITVAGDTTGTWLTTTGIGIRLYFQIGIGSTFTGTAGAWAAGDYRGATGATNIISTLNATFYITGVQLELGSSASSFDYRPYGTELALCQRYYYLVGSGNNIPLGSGSNYTTTSAYGILSFPVTMRVAPTISSTSGTNYYTFFRNATTDDFNSLNLQYSATTGYIFYNGTEISGTAGHGGWIQTNNASAFVAFGAEL